MDVKIVLDSVTAAMVLDFLLKKYKEFGFVVIDFSIAGLNLL